MKQKKLTITFGCKMVFVLNADLKIVVKISLKWNIYGYITLQVVIRSLMHVPNHITKAHCF